MKNGIWLVLNLFIGEKRGAIHFLHPNEDSQEMGWICPFTLMMTTPWNCFLKKNLQNSSSHTPLAKVWNWSQWVLLSLGQFGPNGLCFYYGPWYVPSLPNNGPIDSRRAKLRTSLEYILIKVFVKNTFSLKHFV